MTAGLPLGRTLAGIYGASVIPSVVMQQSSHCNAIERIVVNASLGVNRANDYAACSAVTGNGRRLLKRLEETEQ